MWLLSHTASVRSKKLIKKPSVIRVELTTDIKKLTAANTISSKLSFIQVGIELPMEQSVKGFEITVQGHRT